MRTRPTADRAELAAATATTEVVGGTQVLQQVGVPVDLRERLVAHAADRDREEPARVDHADVVDEGETSARVDIDRGSGRAPFRFVAGEQLGGVPAQLGAQGADRERRIEVCHAGALDGDATVVRCLGRLDGHELRNVVHPVQHLFLLLGRESVEQFAAPGWNQEEHAPERGAQLEHGFQDGRQLVHVVGGDRRVDLQAVADLAHQAGGGHGVVEDVVHAAEGIVGGGGCPVQR